MECSESLCRHRGDSFARFCSSFPLAGFIFPLDGTQRARPQHIGLERGQFFTFLRQRIEVFLGGEGLLKDLRASILDLARSRDISLVVIEVFGPVGQM